MPVWTHPTLGEFTFETYSWNREFESSKFRQFTYPCHDGRRAEHVLLIQFEAYDENEVPAPEVAEVGRKVVENHGRLIDQALELLLEDFRGTSSDSGVWWHGNMDEVLMSIAGNPKAPDKLETVDDLYHHLGQPGILVQDSGYGYDAPCAIIGFEASFDPEHGLGFLTDGDRILGIGYQCDAGAFPENEKR